MTQNKLKWAALLVSTLAVGACSNSYTHESGYDYANTSGHVVYANGYGAQNYQPNYQPNYQLNNYSAQPVHYATYPHTYANSHQGTVLRGGAPYGMAVNNAPYVNTHGYARDTGGYFNLGAVSYDVDSNLYGVQARLGYNVSPYLGAEIEGSIGVNDDTIGGTLTSVDHSAGIFAIAQVPYTKHLTFLTRAGYHTTQYGGPGSASLDTDGFAYGVGAEYSINRKNSLRLDYTRYQSTAANTNDAVALAYAHKF